MHTPAVITSTNQLLLMKPACETLKLGMFPLQCYLGTRAH